MRWWSSPANDLQVTHGARLWLYAVAALAMIFLVVPTLIVVPMSFSDSAFLRFPPEKLSARWYDAYFHSEEWVRATLTSLKVAALTVVLALPLGTAAAYVASRLSSRWISVAYGLILLPVLVPVILLAIGVYLVYAQTALLNTLLGLALAHALLAVPLVFLVMLASFRQIDPNLETAARGLGAGPWRAFFSIALPQVRMGVTTATILAFLTSLDEVVIALFIADGDAATVTRRMFLALRDQIEPVIAAISTLMVALSIILIVAIQILRNRRNRENL